MKFKFTTTLLLTAASAASIAAILPLQRSYAQSSSHPQRLRPTTLSGEVVQIRGDEFILRDGAGQILVEAESYAIREANLEPGDRVTIAGHYDEDSFEAFSIRPVNGAEIFVFDD